MNSKQRILRWLGIALLLACAVLPPWKLSFTVVQTPAKDSSSAGPRPADAQSKPEPVSSQLKGSSFAGYHPVWDPPNAEVEETESESDHHYQVDVWRLGLQLAAVLAITNVGLFLLKDRRTLEESQSES